MEAEVRVDKWLWAVRIFKTRSLATEACKKGQVLIGEVKVKASRIIKLNDVFKVKKAPIVRSFRVIGITGKRVSAKLAVEFMKDVTPSDQLDILEVQKNMVWFNREKGAGRPTKKDRRELDDFINI
jgi:ribosome-associated heat shock protein Hsp15